MATLQFKVFHLTRANHWSEYSTDFEVKYSIASYTKDLTDILKDLLGHVDNNFYWIKLIVFEEEMYFTDHEFIVYIDRGECIIINDENIGNYRDIRIGDIVRHFKYETLTDEERSRNLYKYKILGTGVDTQHWKNVVIYQALYGKFITYVRPFEEFMSIVDDEKYPDIKQVFRFVKDSLED